MKVGIVTENYYPTLGGIQEHVCNLRSFLAGAGVAATVLTGRPARRRLPIGPPDAEQGVRRLGRSWDLRIGGTVTQLTPGPAAAVRLRSALEEERFDLLAIQGPYPALPAMALALFEGPKVVTLHSFFPALPVLRLAGPYCRWVFSRARAVVAVSEATRAAMARYAAFEAAVIPNGVDVAAWENGRPRPDLTDEGHENILYVGRAERRNGLDILMRAFVLLAARRPRARLIVAGDGPLRRRAEAGLPRGLRGRIAFLGPVWHERADLYASATLMVIPARAVGFSIVLLEALAAGLPVVALPAAGLERAGDHWETALLARDRTPQALAEALGVALAEDPMRRIARGRELVRRYDWSVVGPQLLEVFRRALES